MMTVCGSVAAIMSTVMKVAERGLTTPSGVVADLKGVGLATISRLRHLSAQVANDVGSRFRIVGIDPYQHTVKRRRRVDRRIGFLALRVETWRRVRRDHVGQYTAIFPRLVGHRRRSGRKGNAKGGRPEPWCHRLPPVRLGRVARPIPPSYSENTKMPIVFVLRL